MCLCKPGFTGKYCEYGTVFRLDGSYSIQYNIPAGYVAEMTKLGAGYKFHFKFEFRLNFFSRQQTFLPLIYLESGGGGLFLEVLAHREFINVRNAEMGLDEKLGFYYLSDSSDQNEKTWHSIELFVGYDNTIQIGYAVRRIRLSVSKLFRLRSSELNPSSFTLGRFYPVYGNEEWTAEKADAFLNGNYLSGACVRDFVLNGEFLFKSVESGVNRVEGNVKYGCGYEVNQCTGHKEEEKSGAGALARKDTVGSVCLHNSTCLYKYFGFECVKCEMPYYGKRCQFGKFFLFFFFFYKF